MLSKFNANKIGLVAVVVLSLVATTAYATHSWGNYHWARTANPFTVKLGNNVLSNWNTYLAQSSADWTQSSVLDTTVVPGSSFNKRSCSPTAGRVEVCNRTYGFNGWLGVASIWIDGNNHITQGTVKLNDSYFNTTTYNTPAWRQFVMCQEVGHTFGLDHQDVNFSNPNLGTCMDYTNDPAGTLYGQLSNLHPNAHDYQELGIIYQHLDSTTTLGQSIAAKGNRSDANDANDSSQWGNSIRKDGKNRNSIYEKNLGNGEKLFTFVLWTE